jgi:general secretion pathway protein C
MSSTLSMRDFQNVSAQQWLDRASRIVPRVLTVIFVIAIAWQLVQLTWLLLERSPPESMEIAPPPANVVNARPKSVNIQTIVDAHLFGQPQQAAADPTNAPPAQTNLVLTGTWASDDPSKGFAFIGESSNAAKMYGVGKAVRQGTTLHSVYPEKVILDTGGKLESLFLPKVNANLTAQFTRPPPRPAGNQFTENLRRVAESNPAAFAEIIRPQPVFANGVQRGYRVYPGRNRQQFAKLGLQPGDLVTAINGTPLDDPQRGMEIFNTMSASDRVTIMVERNGQPQELSLNTAQMSIPEPVTNDGGRQSSNAGSETPQD